MVFFKGMAGIINPYPWQCDKTIAFFQVPKYCCGFFLRCVGIYWSQPTQTLNLDSCLTSLIHNMYIIVICCAWMNGPTPHASHTQTTTLVFINCLAAAHNVLAVWNIKLHYVDDSRTPIATLTWLNLLGIQNSSILLINYARCSTVV